MSTTHEIRLFSWVKERFGVPIVSLDLPSDARVGDVLPALASIEGNDWLTRAVASCRVAVNCSYAKEDQQLFEGDEIAVIPPVSGGGPIQAAVTYQAIDLDELMQQVAMPSAGAVVLFQGLPRDIAALEYEAYGEMALPMLERLALEVANQYATEALAVHHRVGLVPSGEPCVAVAVATAHRAEAFAAAQLLMDRLKTEVPIWKTEIAAILAAKSA